MSAPTRVLLVENGSDNPTPSIARYTADLQTMLARSGIDARRRGAPWYPGLRPGGLRMRRSLARAVDDFRPQLVHTTSSWLAVYLGMRRFRDLPKVATCHDIIPFVQEDYGGSSRTWPIHRWFLARNRAGYLLADQVICVSQWSADTLIAWADIDPAKVTVIPNVVGEQFRPVADADAVLAAHGIRLPGGPRVLSIGSIEVRKNIPLMLRAMASPGLAGATLVRAGAPLTPSQRELAGHLGIGERVVEVGFVPEEALPALYSACDLLLQPSSFEGFGLPPAEAMACGTPGIVSDATALPGVVGHAGVIVPLHGRDAEEDDARAFATAIERVLSTLALATDLRERGLARIEAEYRPERVRQRVLAVYALAES